MIHVDKNSVVLKAGDIVNIGEGPHPVPCEVVLCVIPQWNKEYKINLDCYCNDVFKNFVEKIGTVSQNPELLEK